MEIGNGTSKVKNSENIEGVRNANSNQAVPLENRLKGNFVSTNVNLSKWNIMMQRFLYSRKDSIFSQHAII